MRRVSGVLFLSSTIVLLAITAAYAAVPEKVLDDPRLDERSAAASPDYFAWSQNLPSNSNLFNSYVRPSGGGPRVRVNPQGTRSWTVGIDGSLVVYQEDFDLAFYDAATQTRDPMPDGVNTRSIEEIPEPIGRLAAVHEGQQEPGQVREFSNVGDLVQPRDRGKPRASFRPEPTGPHWRRSGERRLGDVRSVSHQSKHWGSIELRCVPLQDLDADTRQDREPRQTAIQRCDLAGWDCLLGPHRRPERVALRTQHADRSVSGWWPWCRDR